MRVTLFLLRDFFYTVVHVRITWIKSFHSQPFQFTDPQDIDIQSFHLLFDCIQFSLIHRSFIPGFCTILVFTASEFPFVTRHIHSWAAFWLWSSHFILSETTCSCLPLFLVACWTFPRAHFLYHIWYHIIALMLSIGFFWHRYWSGSPFPFPVDYPLSELSIMICVS